MSEVDVSALDELADDIKEFNKIALGQLVLRGEELTLQEVPKITHRLERGVTSDIDYDKLEGLIIISARSEARGARTATFVGKDGSIRPVKLRPTKSYNYAEVVAKGNKKAKLRPKKAKAFLIPVPSPPDKGSYIRDGDEIFVVRTSRDGQKANPYHERAAKRLTKEGKGILEGIAEEFFQ